MTNNLRARVWTSNNKTISIVFVEGRTNYCYRFFSYDVIHASLIFGEFRPVCLIVKSTFDGQPAAHRNAISRQQQMLIFNRWAEIISVHLHRPARRTMGDCMQVRYERDGRTGALLELYGGAIYMSLGGNIGGLLSRDRVLSTQIGFDKQRITVSAPMGRRIATVSHRSNERRSK